MKILYARRRVVGLFENISTAKTILLLFSGCIILFFMGCVTTNSRSFSEIDNAPISVEILRLNDNEKQINLIYYENKMPVPEKEIFYSYYDETSLTRVLKKGITNSKGIFSFIVPANADGGSSVFNFALNEPDIQKVIGFRIPSGKEYKGNDPNVKTLFKKKSLTIKFDKNYLIRNEESPVQLMRFPINGEKIAGEGDILLEGSLFRGK